MSRGATARLFVAIDPPPETCARLAAWARTVAARGRAAGSSRGGLRLLDAESMHLTLCFLGNRPVGEIDALAAALGSCSEHACELSVGAPLWLPPRRPRTLAVEIHDRDGELARLQERLTAELASASDWQPERRRFRAHVSLARVRGGAGAGRDLKGADPDGRASQGIGRPARDHVGDLHSLPPTPRLSFSADALILYRSWLASEGASYEALASCTLAAAGR